MLGGFKTIEFTYPPITPLPSHISLEICSKNLLTSYMFKRATSPPLPFLYLCYATSLFPLLNKEQWHVSRYIYSNHEGITAIETDLIML